MDDLDLNSVTLECSHQWIFTRSHKLCKACKHTEQYKKMYHTKHIFRTTPDHILICCQCGYLTSRKEEPKQSEYTTIIDKLNKNIPQLPTENIHREIDIGIMSLSKELLKELYDTPFLKKQTKIEDSYVKVQML